MAVTVEVIEAVCALATAASAASMTSQGRVSVSDRVIFLAKVDAVWTKAADRVGQGYDS